jgi:hypothetical protein
VHGENSAAGDEWICIASSSEFEYYFVNVDKNSVGFESTRKITNNCFED